MNFTDIDKFLSSQRKAPCSWCGGSNWGIHTIQSADPSQEVPGVVGEAELRGLARMRMREVKKGELRATISLGAPTAVPAIVAECLGCGKMDFFNFHAVARLMEQARETPDATGAKPTESNGGAEQ